MITQLTQQSPPSSLSMNRRVLWLVEASLKPTTTVRLVFLCAEALLIIDADGYNLLKNSNVAITLHDAFLGIDSWNNFAPGLPYLVLDTHHYEIFDSGSLAWSPATHVSTACGFANQLLATNKWTICGEWTGAMTDCAKWLNGLGVGARYDGTFSAGSSFIGSCAGKSVGTVAGLSATDKTNIGRFIEAQLDAYEKSYNAGWIFWYVRGSKSCWIFGD